jgi:hypothetical protein
MRSSIKGALLSGLVFPGLGQVVLKSYARGGVLILAVIMAIAVLVMDAVQRAQVILQEIEAEGGPISMYTITEAANRSAEESAGAIPGMALLLILGCWFFGIIDAYITGSKIDSGK